MWKIEEKIEDNLELKKILSEKTNINIDSCYQCGKCSGGCPVVFAMDYTPRQINHLIQLDKKEEILNSSSIWICASCNTCTTRCPREIDIAKVMDVMRSISYKEKKCKLRDIGLFHSLFLKIIKKEGRLNEVAFTMEYQIRRGNYFGNIKNYFNFALRMGPKLFFSGKINPLNLILPKKIKDLKTIKNIFTTIEK